MAQKTLVIDTATTACSVALFEGTELISGQYEEIGRGHAERLVPMIAALPDAGKADHIVVNRGPGSFTGIRIGIATARALALAWESSLASYTSDEILAAEALSSMESPNPITICMNAGHGEIFVSAFDEHGITIQKIQSVLPEQAAELSGGRPVVGSAANAMAELTGSQIVGSPLPNAENWAQLVNVRADSTDISPLYVRPPDAIKPRKLS